VRISYLEKFYIVAIDCPGYGRSKGSKEAVKTFPLKMFQEILSSLRYKNYFAMLGHSQGGAAIFNAVFEEPTLTDFMVMDRPVCGNIQRFRGFSLPTLLIYDIEDDGHPIWQGKLLYK
jgi:pimeloyl-ACP methyl ester carboxylesterase